MKDEEYIFSMLQRAEMKKRKAFKTGDDLNFNSYNLLIRQLKIILDIKGSIGKRKRLKQVMDFNESLI